jgi:hypothetical protein
MKGAVADRFIRNGIGVGRIGPRHPCGLSWRLLCRSGRGFSGRPIEEIKGAAGQYDDAYRSDDCEAWQPR